MHYQIGNIEYASLLFKILWYYITVWEKLLNSYVHQTSQTAVVHLLLNHLQGWDKSYKVRKMRYYLNLHCQHNKHENIVHICRTNILIYMMIYTLLHKHIKQKGCCMYIYTRHCNKGCFKICTLACQTQDDLYFSTLV